MKRRIVQGFCLPLLMLAVLGCGSSGPRLGQVEGTITLDGQPLPEALVTFYPKDGRPSSGVTDSNGVYRLQFTADKAGAALGEHVVRITANQQSGEEVPTKRVQETLQEIYNRDSILKADVKSGKNKFDFALEKAARLNP